MDFTSDDNSYFDIGDKGLNKTVKGVMFLRGTQRIVSVNYLFFRELSPDLELS